MKPKLSRNYFRLGKEVFFFSDDDRESIEAAYRYACAVADRLKYGHDAIAVWRMPEERGAWTPTKTNRGVSEIGSNRPSINLN